MPNPPVTFPALFTPANAVAFTNVDGTAQNVSASAPLPVAILGSVGTQAISAVSLPLPAGAASAANQGATNTSLSAISAQLPASLGAKAAAASLSVSVPTDLANLEPAGSAVAGTAMPSGGTGLTGWLSAIFRSCSEGATVSASVTSAANVVSVSNNLYMGGSFQVTNAGTSCTVSYEQSNDGTNWIALPVISAASPNAAPATTSTTTGIYSFVSSAAFVRARVSTYTSGTVSLVLSQKQQAAPIAGLSLAASSAVIGSVVATGTVNPGTGFTDSTTALAAAASFVGTGRTNSAAQLEFFTATAFADQGGTLFIEQSLDSGATYQPIMSQAVGAGGAANMTARMSGAVGTATLYRVRYVNGPALQTVFRLSSGFSAS